MRTTTDPLVDPKLVMRNPFLAANLYNFLFGAAAFGFFSFVPYYAVVKYGLTVFESEYNTNWGPLFAGYVLAALPLLILFAVASRWFIEGFSSGAVKL